MTALGESPPWSLEIWPEVRCHGPGHSRVLAASGTWLSVYEFPAQIQTLIPNTKPVTPFQTQGPTPPGAALCKRLGLGGEQQPRGAPVGRWAASAAPGLPSVHGGRPTGPAAPDLPGEPGPRRAAQGGQADRQGPPAALAPTTCPRERTPSLPAPELPRTPPSASPALAGVRVVFVI